MPLLTHFEDLFSDYVVSEFGDKYVFRWTGLDEESPETSWDKAKTLMTWDEARQAHLNLDPVPGGIGSAPLNPALMSAWQSKQQADSQDFGDPDAPGAGGPPGADDEQGGDDAGGPQGQDQAEGDMFDAGDDNGPDMQKAFGLPLLQIKP